MWLIVRSPHDGREVKVREKDVGRSVRDGEGKLFYLLKKEDGSGCYGSLTREGGPQQEAHYDRMLAKERHAQDVAAEATRRQVHDATGKSRSSMRGKLVVLVFVIVVLAILWAILAGPLKNVRWSPTPAPNPAPNPAPTPVPTPPSIPPTDPPYQPQSRGRTLLPRPSPQPSPMASPRAMRVLSLQIVTQSSPRPADSSWGLASSSRARVNTAA